MAVRTGIPHELFWELTLEEVEAVVRVKIDEDRAATLRAGLIAATILNVNRRKGTALVHPQDFIREQDEYLDPETARGFMDRWAQAQNAGAIVAPSTDEVTKFGG